MKEIIKKIGDGRLLVEVTKRIYNESAITYSAYKFTEWCYIRIDPDHTPKNSAISKLTSSWYKNK